MSRTATTSPLGSAGAMAWLGEGERHPVHEVPTVSRRERVDVGVEQPRGSLHRDGALEGEVVERGGAHERLQGERRDRQRGPSVGVAGDQGPAYPSLLIGVLVE